VWDAESGELHRDLEGFEGEPVMGLASFLSPDGQQPTLVAGSSVGRLRVYDPEAGSTLHRLEGHASAITGLACIASSSAAPHHPRLVSVCSGGTALVWDGETGERLTDLRGHERPVTCVAVWKEHTGERGHDRIATADRDRRITVWDGEALTLLHDLDIGSRIGRLLAFESAEGPTRLLVGLDRGFLQVWDPEEGRLLHDNINRGCPLDHCHMFESAQGRHLPPGHCGGWQAAPSAPRQHVYEGLPRRVGPGGGPGSGPTPAAGAPFGLREPIGRARGSVAASQVAGCGVTLFFEATKS
jgi:WD40 repeat protein